jgi:hypothetical protein
MIACCGDENKKSPASAGLFLQCLLLFLLNYERPYACTNNS